MLGAYHASIDDLTKRVLMSARLSGRCADAALTHKPRPDGWSVATRYSSANSGNTAWEAVD